MSKKEATKNILQIQEQIKPILEGLTLGVLKNKPDNIVSYNNFYFNQPLFMIKYLQEAGNYKNDLTDEQMKELEGLKKELEKYQKVELIEKSHSDSDSGSND